MPAQAWLWLAALAACIAFAPGLGGPFVLDDHVNLEPIRAWQQGQASLADAVFGNSSGPTGRPFAYLTLAANAAVDPRPAGFKFVNLVLHLVAGFLLFSLLASLRDSRGTALVAMPVAVLTTALWWVHPLQVSSLLYVVQRMALLGAIAQLAALLVYVHARSLPPHNAAASRWLIFAAFPAIVALGTLAKETALLAFPIALVLEWAVFDGRRPQSVRIFCIAAVSLPILAIAVIAALDPGLLLNGYESREFGPVQRAISELRILWHYVASILAPGLGQLALYRDGFALSSSLASPPTGVASLLAWVVVVAGAFFGRRRAPLVALGIGWFLAGHLLESSLVPLEPYFEHRNYLPSAGLLLAAVSVAAFALRGIPRALATALACTLVLALGVSTAWRSHAWSDIDSLLRTEGPRAPEISRRLQVDRAIRAVERGDAQARVQAIETLAQGNRGDRATGALWSAILNCHVSGELPAPDREALLSRSPFMATHNHLSALGLLVKTIEAGHCRSLDRKLGLDVIEAWSQQGGTMGSTHAIGMLRTYRTRLGASAGTG